MKKRLLIISSIVILVVIIAGLAFAHFRDTNLPGKVIGNNPSHIAKKALPVCDFDGTKFIETPCYSPPDSLYD